MNELRICIMVIVVIIYIGVIFIDENICWDVLKCCGQKVKRLECVIGSSLCCIWLVVQVVYEDNVDLGIGMSVYSGGFVVSYVVICKVFVRLQLVWKVGNGDFVMIYYIDYVEVGFGVIVYSCIVLDVGI